MTASAPSPISQTGLLRRRGASSERKRSGSTVAPFSAMTADSRGPSSGSVGQRRNVAIKSSLSRVGLWRLRGRRRVHLLRHQLVDEIVGVALGYLGQNVLEVGLGVQAIEQRRSNLCVDRCCPVAAAI